MRKQLLNRLQEFQEDSLKKRKIRIRLRLFMVVKNLYTRVAFLNLYLGNYKPVFQNDMNWKKANFTRILARKTEVEEKAVYSFSLRSYKDFMFEERKKYCSHKLLINQTNLRGRKNKGFAVRFCFYYLKKQDYFRKKWKFTFSTACTNHKVFFLNRTKIIYN